MPTAKPRIRRDTIRISMLEAKAEPREPRINNSAAAIRLYLRPSRKESQPLASAPNAAPSIMMLTTHSCWRLLSTKCSVIKGSAPEITPISRPNNSPAIAAAKDTNRFITLVFLSELSVSLTTSDDDIFFSGKGEYSNGHQKKIIQPLR